MRSTELSHAPCFTQSIVRCVHTISRLHMACALDNPAERCFLSPVSPIYLDCYLPLHRTGAPHLLKISSLQQWCTYPLQPGLGYIIHPCHGAGQPIFAFCLSLPKHDCATHHNRICIAKSDRIFAEGGSVCRSWTPRSVCVWLSPDLRVFFFFSAERAPTHQGRQQPGKSRGEREGALAFLRV